MTAAVVSHVRKHGVRSPAHPIGSLTAREREVLVLIARDRVQAVIAAFESGLAVS